MSVQRYTNFTLDNPKRGLCLLKNKSFSNKTGGLTPCSFYAFKCYPAVI